MVKFYSSTDSYPYSFPAVTLAYFLRYPNPYSTHVVSTDTISRSYDPETQLLTTLRLHLKKSKLPAAVLKLLPSSAVGASKQGDSQSFILEKSTVDVKQGKMWTESRNLEWTGVLSVVERQVFSRPQPSAGFPGISIQQQGELFGAKAQQTTDIETTVTLHSRIGENFRKRRAARLEAGQAQQQQLQQKQQQLQEQEQEQEQDEQEEEKPRFGGLLRQWANGPIQRSIEIIGLRRAEKSQPKAKEGMKLVLERMRHGGLKGVLEGIRRDTETIATGGVFRLGKEEGDMGDVDVTFDGGEK